MNQQEREVYEAWLRQQLRVEDIRPNDFIADQFYFDQLVRDAIRRPNQETRVARQTYINAMAAQVAVQMDGTKLNDHRQLTGRSYRASVTRQYIDSLPEGDPPIRFVYHPYTGALTIAMDWTIGYDGINPMGDLSCHFSEESRQAELHDGDGTRYPESEIYPVEYQEALYHLLRIKQFRPDSQGWQTRCGMEHCELGGPCEHSERANRILDEEYRKFRLLIESRTPGAPRGMNAEGKLFGGLEGGRLTATSIHEYLLGILDTLDFDEWPETIVVHEWAPVRVRDQDLNVLGNLLENLDENFGDPEDAPTSPSDAMKEAEAAFREVIQAEYKPWVHLLTGVQHTVNVLAWVLTLNPWTAGDPIYPRVRAKARDHLES